MFENYERQFARPGQTVAYEVTELRNADGTHPVVHLEHLGNENAAFRERMIARAGSEEKIDERETVIACSARRLERAYKSDGSLATNVDLPAFINALPQIVFNRLVRFALDETNYAEYPIATDPQALAEKS